MTSRFKLAALSLMVLSTAPASLAEKPGDKGSDVPVSAVNITGEWSFIANTGPECSFSGSALLSATEKPSRYACELTAVQICPTSKWQVRQTCAATRIGDEVIIASKIEEYIEGEPDKGYKPDNFKLTIKSPDLMKGVLVSWGFHNAEFRRVEGAVS